MGLAPCRFCVSGTPRITNVPYMYFIEEILLFVSPTVFCEKIYLECVNNAFCFSHMSQAHEGTIAIMSQARLT